MPTMSGMFRMLALATLPALTVGPVRAGDPGRMQWKPANFTWVKRVPAEPGAPANDQPARIPRESLAAALASVRCQGDGPAEPLFVKDEAVLLAKTLGEAFALAQPGEDLVLLSTVRRSGGLMAPTLGVTARLFLKDGALNLIVHDTRLDFMGRYVAENTLPVFAYGTRGTASGARLEAPGATRLRADWLALPLAVPAAAPSAPPAPTVAPAPTPAPAVPVAPAPPARDAAFYAAQTERLRALKKLRDENLISEAEYQAKREAILRDF